MSNRNAELPAADAPVEPADIRAARNGAGTDSQNEAPPAEQRSPKLRSEVSAGPNIGPAGEFRPAAYPVAMGAVSLIREDR